MSWSKSFHQVNNIFIHKKNNGLEKTVIEGVHSLSLDKVAQFCSIMSSGGIAIYATSTFPGLQMTNDVHHI